MRRAESVVKIAERWLVMAGVGLLGAIALAGVIVAVYAAWVFHDLPDTSELADYRPPTATRVYAGDGTLIGEFSDERRIYVTYDQIPETVVHAFLAAEDSNFFGHGGIDVSGLGRAMINNVFNLASGRRLEGGSTISQQVAKNVLLTNETSLNRKLKEAILTSRLETVLSKEQILELYLNEIFLGYRSYGVASAAFNYFGKSLNQLTPDEAAFLAALPKGPNNYHPKRHPGAAKGRRDWVLNEMADNRWLSRPDLETALARPLQTLDAPRRAAYADADFFVEEARRRAIGLFGRPEVNGGGYYMRTTLDPDLQSAARDALMRGLENYDRRHGWRGPWGKTEFEDGWQQAALRRTVPAERRTWEAAAVESVSGNTVRIRTARTDREGALVSADAAWANARRRLERGDLIFVEPSGGQFALKQVPAVNGALVAIEPQTGRVLAMVGGYSYAISSFNRATQARRQPGSAYKPFVYATALEGDFTPASIVLDAPISFPGGPGGRRWTPENYSRQYYGPQTLRRGLELSRNVMTVRLAQAVGMDKIVAQSEKMGLPGLTPNLSVSLGAGETTPYQLTAAYAAFVNGGRRIDPYLIELVQDRNGETIYRADRRQCRDCGRGFSGQESPRLPDRGEQVLDPITAYQLSSMLEGVVQRGTAASARGLGRWVGGKTGTTNEYRSAWFVGFTTDIVVGVFVGYDDNRSLGGGEAGASTAVPIFNEFMQTALKERPARPFVRPRNAVFRTVNGIEEAFRPGTERQAPPPRPAEPVGPQNYYDVIRREAEAAGQTPPPAAAGPPPPVTPPPPRKQPAEDLTGLY
ncbi:penicillin-binding protein 1A [Brevundimonas sp. S30B]|uniref:penicillin-binding protein 1A n=1 Tax=unclassified Brevundimonas TaxID=2622653 RepID=UPI001072C1D4|nr:MULTISPECIES: penicillin-binding protein 1A [unclassified Brevundimonas]QBX38488.1 penicillin-binding protein 1A [Brevundimonas sp. MF30-B]TFW02196.1 penicillin-binding protein 1A [Brevundimonas sp. S30B]